MSSEPDVADFNKYAKSFKVAKKSDRKSCEDCDPLQYSTRNCFVLNLGNGRNGMDAANEEHVDDGAHSTARLGDDTSSHWTRTFPCAGIGTLR